MAEEKNESKSTALATKDIHSLLNRKDVLAELRKVLPEELSPERLARISLTVIQKSPGLKKCSPLSLLACVVEVAQLRLDPDPLLGEVYFVPYKDQATIQIGYKGFAKLAFNTGDIHKITTFVVRKGEKFKATAGTSETLIHDPKDHGFEKDDSTWTHAYAVAFFRDGHSDHQVLERAEVFRRRAKSRAFAAGKKDSPWFTDPEMMWKKSAIRALASRLPKSTTDNRLARAAKLDELADLGLLTPTTTGFEIAEDVNLLNEDNSAADPPIQPSKEIEKKRPAGGSKKSKKSQQPDGGNPLVPKAQIPSGDAIDVKPIDPVISKKQLGDIYEVGNNNAQMGMERVREWVKTRYGCNVSELRVSQYEKIVNIFTNGE